MPPTTPLDLRVAIGLPPARAVEYFRSKGYAVTENWQDLWQDAHARAFTVAGAAKLDVLEAIRDQVDAALAGDIAQRDFVRRLAPTLQDKGWWGKQVAVDEATGEARLAQAGSVWRLKTILRTNLQSAYMAGRWRQMMENVRFRPYWQYVAVMDERTRPAHAAMNGLVFRYDDPFWLHFFPPNGFNCRCTVRALSEADLRSRGLSVSDSGRYLRQVWSVDKRSGFTEQIAVYKAPGMRLAGRTDLGWNYNPGQAAWQPDLDGRDPELARAYVASQVSGAPFDRFIAGKTEGDFPVAVLAPAEQELLGAKSQQVLLASDTVAAQRASSPSIGVDDYRRIQAIVDQGEIFRRRSQRVAYFAVDGVWYRATLALEQDGKRVSLASLERVDERDVKRARSALERLQ